MAKIVCAILLAAAIIASGIMWPPAPAQAAAENEGFYDTQTQYEALKSAVESDGARLTAANFDTDIDCIRSEMGVGFNFGNCLEWSGASTTTDRFRSYMIRISLGNNTTEYFHWEGYVNEAGNIFEFSNRPSTSQNYAELKLTRNSAAASLSSSAPINYLKVTVRNNRNAAARGVETVVNVKDLRIINASGNAVTINNYTTDVLGQHSVTIPTTPSGGNYTATVVEKQLSNVTYGNFYGTQTRILANIQLDKFVSDYKNNATGTYTNSYNGASPSEAELDFLWAQGIRSLRIPVTYFNHMDSTGKVDPEWFTEINRVINLAIHKGFYVITNIHSDAMIAKANGAATRREWIIADPALFEQYQNTYRYLCLQIAENFKNFGDHLILEGPNEVANYDGATNNLPTSPISNEEYMVVNQLNQIFVDEVRRTGYNNTNRVLVVSPYFAGRLNLGMFALPSDTATDKLLVGLHDYTIREGGTLASLNWFRQAGGAPYLQQYKFVMTEFGMERAKSLADRLSLMNINVPLGYDMGIPMMVWDDGGNYRMMNQATDISARWDTEIGSDQVAQAMINHAVTHAINDHPWGTPTYTWNSENTEVTATVICQDDSRHTKTETAAVTKDVTVQATCMNTGTEVYTATFMQTPFTTQTKTVNTPTGDHAWGSWVVITPATAAVPGLARRVCEHNNAHVEEMQIMRGGRPNAAGTFHNLMVDASHMDLEGGPVEEHIFYAYQILTGDTSSPVAQQMTVTDWGDGIDSAGLIAAFNSDPATYVTKGGKVERIPDDLVARFKGVTRADDFATRASNKYDPDNDGIFEPPLTTQQIQNLAKVLRAFVLDGDPAPEANNGVQLLEEAFVVCTDVQEGEDVLGLYTYNGTTFVLAAGTAVAGETYYEKLMPGRYGATVNDGYWLVVDNTLVGGNVNEVASADIIQVVDNVEVTFKGTVPKVTKGVQKEAVTTGYTDFPGALPVIEFANMGEKLTFTLAGVTSSKLSSFNSYFYCFHDQLAKGFDFDYLGDGTALDPSAIRVYAGATDITNFFRFYKSYDFETRTGTEFTFADEKSGDPLDIYIVCPDLKRVSSLTGSDIITVSYTATLNSSATVGGIGNKNTVRLAYGNNPDTQEIGFSDVFDTSVFTLQLQIEKKDEANQDLPGAKFALFRTTQEGKLEFATATSASEEDSYEEAVGLTSGSSVQGYYTYDPLTGLYVPCAAGDVYVDGTIYYQLGDPVRVYTITGWTAGVPNVSGTASSPAAAEVPAEAGIFSTGESGDITTYCDIVIRGLSGGSATPLTYYVQETAAPAGYVKMGDGITEMNITAMGSATGTLISESYGPVPVSEVNATNFTHYFLPDGSGGYRAVNPYGDTFNPATTYYQKVYENDYGLVTLTVPNMYTDIAPGHIFMGVMNLPSTSELPTTGGTGTIIMTVVGFLIAAAAGVFLIVKKRSKSLEYEEQNGSAGKTE